LLSVATEGKGEKMAPEFTRLDKMTELMELHGRELVAGRIEAMKRLEQLETISRPNN
jgi:hypothetical protein